MAKQKQSNAIKIFLAIILASILFGLVNLGVFTFMASPELDDFCVEDPDIVCAVDDEIREPCLKRDCDFNAFDNARDNYENTLFYIFISIGFVLAFVGLFITNLIFQIVGLGSGSALIIQGIILNLNNRIPAFIAGVAVFTILSIFIYRKFRD